MTEPNTVALPPGIVPMPPTDVDRRLAETVGILMRRHHHAVDSQCDWCLEVARRILADTTNLIKAQPHRDDPVAAFIRRHRDDRIQQDEVGSAAHDALDDLLDTYRLYADTGRLLTEPPPSTVMHPDDDEERLEPAPRTVPGMTRADHSRASHIYNTAYLTYLGAHIEDDGEPFGDADLNRSVAAQGYALAQVADHAYALAEKRHANDAANALITFRDLNHYPSRMDPGMCCCAEEIERDGSDAGCYHWQALTDAARDIRIGGADLPPSVLHRAVDGFSRSNTIVDADVFGEVLAEIGAKLADEFRAFRAAFHADQVRRMPYPLAAIDNALAVLSALTAALNRTRTPTAADLVAQERDEQVTAAGDQVRLHVLSYHGIPEVLGMRDEAAARLHGYLHAGRINVGEHIPHDPGNGIPFRLDEGDTIVSAIPATQGGQDYRRLFREQGNRVMFGDDQVLYDDGDDDGDGDPDGAAGEGEAGS